MKDEVKANCFSFILHPSAFILCFSGRGGRGVRRESLRAGRAGLRRCRGGRGVCRALERCRPASAASAFLDARATRADELSRLLTETDFYKRAVCATLRPGVAIIKCRAAN